MRNFPENRRRWGKMSAWLWALGLPLAASGASAFEWPKLPKMFGGEEKPATGAPSSGGVSCPEIQIVGGAPELRSPPGADAGSVRYQIRLGDMARECTVAGDQLSIKVGVEGAAILGPAGQPGSYYGNMRVAVQRQKDEALLGAKVYRVGGTIPAGGSRAEFRVVADPIVIPYDARVGEEYVVIVTMQGGADAETVAAKPRRRRR